MQSKEIPPSSPNRNQARSNWHAICFGLGIAVLGAYQQFKLPPVLPDMLAHYAYDPVLAGGYMSIFAIAGLLLSGPLGAGMQKRGAKPYLAAALALIVAGAALILGWPEVGAVVLLGRGLEGIAMAILAIVGPTMMTRGATPRDRAVAVALAATWVPLGALVGGIVARTANGLGDGDALWMWNWWAGIGFGLALVVWAGLLLRDGRIALDLRPDTPSAAPQNRLLRLTAAAFMLWATQNIIVMTWLPSYLTDVHGFTAGDAVSLYLAAVFVLGFFNLVGGALLRAGQPIMRVMLAALTGQMMFLVLGVFAGSDVIGLAILLGYSAFTGVVPTCIFGMPGEVLGRQGTGTGSFGLLMTGRNLGILVGPVGVAAAAEWYGGWQVMPVAAAAATAGSLLLALWLAIAMRHRAERDA